MLDRANLRFQSIVVIEDAVAGKIAKVFTTFWTKDLFVFADAVEPSDVSLTAAAIPSTLGAR